MTGSRAGWWIGALLGLALGLGALLVYALTGGFEAVEARRVGSIGAERENAIVRATQRVSPCVVSVTSFRHSSSRTQLSDWLQRFFDTVPAPSGPPASDALEASNVGSGLIIDSEGYILTNYHVVAGAEKIAVTLSSGEDLEAEIVNSSRTYDLSVLRLAGNVSGLPVAPLGDSDGVVIGEWAIAIGSPYGSLLADTSPTVTVGVISATHRDIRPDSANAANLFDMIQTDAAIHPGNSGGPLVNSRGEVIGINSFLIGGQGGTGLGFAVPINRGKWVMDEILNYGRVRDTYYGMDGNFVSPTTILSNRLRSDTPSGYLVTSVHANSPAERAGVRLGDVITHVGGKDIRNSWELTRGLFSARVGSSVEIRVWRNGRSFSLDIVPVEQSGAGS